MPELRCTVQTCRHNQNDYCNLDKITVGGDAATAPKDTCCDSFEEKTGGYSNQMEKQASPISDVDCQATECQYNKNCSCQAGKISVEGSGACTCGQTECATFDCGCQ